MHKTYNIYSPKKIETCLIVFPVVVCFNLLNIFHFICSESVLCEGSPEIAILEDGWTVVTKDGKRWSEFKAYFFSNPDLI